MVAATGVGAVGYTVSVPGWDRQPQSTGSRTPREDHTMVFLKIQTMILLLWPEVLKFGLVGSTGWVLDNGIYALLWHGPMSESTI